jgi:hypothetical protein
LCEGVLVPEGRRHGHRYFRHERDADVERCPLTTSDYQLAGMLVDHPRDEIEHEQRARFIEHWQRHYRAAKAAAPMLTMERFTHLIAYADVVNLWSCPQLDDRDLPYVLLVMAGFMTMHRKGGETTRERLWFEGSIRRAEDLWKPGRPTRARLFRIVYRDPVRTPFPVGTDILYWELMTQVSRMADTRASRVSGPEIQAFEWFIERHDAWRRDRDLLHATDSHKNGTEPG